ncbi:MAG: HEAT repeat domain-containing protein [Acidobacteriaceae bacterium]
MKKAILILALSISSAGFAQSLQAPPVLNLFSPDDQAANREEELYRDGTQYLDESKWSQALQKFDQVAALKARRADGALYWKAYSLNKLGRRQEALSTISSLRSAYPKSAWLKDAGALELEVKQATGQPVRPNAQSDEDYKLLAMNSIMESDPDRAIPIIEAMLNKPTNSPRLKERALFVLAQSDSPKAQQALASVARGQQGPQLQEKAIQFLGTESSPANMKLLGEIYASSQDSGVRRAVLRAYMVGDNQAGVFAAAQRETNPEVKREAVHLLGAMEAKKELAQLYPGADAETRRAILDACVAADDSELLAQVAKNPNESLDLRRGALQRLGAVGGKETSATLVQIYRSESNPEMKNAAIEGLFVDDDAKDLVALARSEADPQMRKRIVEKLALMDDREAKDYMLEILNK